MANTNLDIILSSMGRSQDPNFDDILSASGGAQAGGPIVITLGTLTLSTAITSGTVTNGSINGAYSGSTITSGVTGLTVNSGARTFSFDGTAVAGTVTAGLTETLAGATNSPKTNPITVLPSGAASIAAPTNWDMTAFGDSLTENGTSGILNANGYQAISSNYGWAGWIEQGTQGRVRLGRYPNFGCSTSTTTQMAANPRLDGVNGTTPAGVWYRPASSTGFVSNKGYTDVAAHPAGIAMFQMGINDQNSSYAATSRTNTLTILSGSGSKLKVLFTIFPTGVNTPTGGTSTLKKGFATDEMRAFADWQKTLDFASGHANARSDTIVIDLWSEFLDAAGSSTGSWKNNAQYLRDGLHWTAYACKRASELLHARLIAVYGATYTGLASQIVLPTGNPTGGVGGGGTGNGNLFVHSNPLMLDGTGTGQVITGSSGATFPAATALPQGISLSASGTGGGITILADKTITNAAGFRGVRLTISGTLADASVWTLSCYQAVAVAGQLTATKKIRGVANVKVAAGSQQLAGVALRQTVQCTESATRTQVATAFAGGAGGTNDRAGYLFNVANGDAAGDYVLQTQMNDLADPFMDTANGGPGVMGTIGSTGIYLDMRFDNQTGASQTVSAVIDVFQMGMELVTS